jgi:aryl-alcohol dehydrogenase-like predicted oxidoreductase
MPATPAQTRVYFERLKTKGVKTPPSNLLGATGLTVSRLGFGCYRVHEFEPENRQALRDAILGGVNLIDTSTTYTDGSSERLVGDVTRAMIEEGLVTREEIVIVTKAGYVQGSAMREAKERAGTARAYPEMVEFQQDCWHNISPAYLEEQITKSLQRMKIDAIDVLLLHNPEYFLKAGGSREKYYERIERAFKHLESEVSKGRIKAYGISSNTFPEVESRSDFTSLTKVFDIAKSVAPQHHFQVIQFPFNLYEAGAALHLNNNRKSVFDFALANNLGVLTNRPYNAFAKGRVSRLTSFPTHDEVEIKGGLHTTLGRAIELEKKAPGYPKSAQGFQWAHALREKLSDLDDLLSWREALYGQIYPSIRQALQRIDSAHAQWAQDYETAVAELLKLVTMDLENLAEQKSKLLSEQVGALVEGLTDSKTLSQRVLRLYLAFPAISSVLVGMRTPKYVSDSLSVADAVAPDKAHTALLSLQRYRS